MGEDGVEEIWWTQRTRGRGRGRRRCGNLVDATDKGKRLWLCMKSLGSNEVGNWLDVDGRGFVGGIVSAPGFFISISGTAGKEMGKRYNNNKKR